MLRILFFVLFSSFLYQPVWGQNVSHLTPIESAQSLVKDFTKVGHSNYEKYILMLEYVGPITYKELTKKGISQLLQQNRADGRMSLTANSMALFRAALERYSPENYKGADRVVINEARTVIKELHRFSKQVNPNQMLELVARYESDGYSIRRSLKTGMLHLPGEILRFAAAIVIVRIATCFGDSPGKVLQRVTTWQTPKMVAKNTDPVCMEEVAEMLTSPIFYIGFTAFIAGSRIATPAMMKILKKMDPDRGPRTQRLEKNWIPHLSMAIGFMSDHIVKTLLENVNLKECMKVAVPNTIGNGANAIYNSAIKTRNLLATDKEDDEEYEVIDYYSTFNDLACRKAARSLTSNKFLQHEMGVGLVGLVTTGVAMAKTFEVAGKPIKYIDTKLKLRARMEAGKTALSLLSEGKGLRKRMLKFAFTVGTGPVGLAIGTARMVVFLGLFEVINPYIEEAYVNTILKEDVDTKTENLANETLKYTPRYLPKHATEQCAKYYSGLQDDGSLEKCSTIPMISELHTFHDISKTWRADHILKKFHMAHGRWQKKLTSFVNNYLGSLESLSVLSRTREMHLKYQQALANNNYDTQKLTADDYISEHHLANKQAIEDVIQKNLKNEYRTKEERQKALGYIQGEFWKQIEEYDYRSPLSTLPLTDHKRRIFDLVQILNGQEFTLNNLPYGFLYDGINGPERVPSLEELVILTQMITAFVGDKNDPNYEHIEIDTHQVHTQILNEKIEALLPEATRLGLSPELLKPPYDASLIVQLIQADNPSWNAIGLLLWQDWAPFMYGRHARRQLKHSDGRFNPRGMTPYQWSLFEQINASLEHYNPTFEWELLYQNVTFKKELSRPKSETEAQFKKLSHGFETELFTDFILTELMCGKSPSARGFFGDNGGVALEFPFPQMLNEGYCDQLLLPLHMQGEASPSPFRSVFVSEQGLGVGLHQGYITAPASEDHPLLVTKEQEIGDWWNREFRPAANQRLRQAKSHYQDLIKKEFSAVVSDSEVDNSSWYSPIFSITARFFGGSTAEQKQLRQSPGTESLTLSIINEFHHYRRILQHVLSEPEQKSLNPELLQMGKCLVKLLNSIPEKNYRVTREGCYPTLDNVKKVLLTRNGKYVSRSDIEDLLNKKEDHLSAEDMRDRILMTTSEMIEKLFSEIEQYNELVHHSFQFELNEGEAL